MDTKQTIRLYSLCALLIAPALGAQQQNSAPIPAYQSPLMPNSVVATNGESSPNEQVLSGVKGLSIGIPTSRSYWQPHFDVFGVADSNALETTHGTGWTTWISGSAGLDIHHVSGNSNLALSYTSGGMYSNEGTARNGIIEGLNFVDTLSFHRWAISLFDQASYLPEAAFGFSGLGGASLPGAGAAGISGAFGTNQSILTGTGQNLGNSFATELDIFLNPRSSLTFLGGYSLLHYFNGDLFNYGSESFRSAYNYKLTERNTTAVFYTYSAYNFSKSTQSIDEHTIQLSYGRLVTNRLAFQIAAGPQIAISNVPITGAAITSTSGGTSTQAFWTLNTSIQYQSRRNEYYASYSHGVTGGSGVLTGAITDIAQGSVVHLMSRTFSSSLNAGYSRNRGVNPSGTEGSGQIYDYWFGGTSLSFPLRETLGLTTSYQAQYQTANATFCLGPTCGTAVIRHVVTVGLAWHERPLLF